MSTYTLYPQGDHGVSKKEVAKQFAFFLKTLRKVEFEFDGLKGLRQDAKIMKRWGTLEAGTLASAARKHPDRLGLVDDDGELTYAQFLDEVYRLAHGLQNLGVTGGDRIAVMALNGRAAIFPLCARQMLGFHIFMINGNSSGPQIQRVLEFHDIDTMIIDESFVDRLTEETLANTRIILGHLEDDQSSEKYDDAMTMQSIIDSVRVGVDRLPENPVRSQHIVMTSGTTGMPKGVVRRQLKSPQGIAPVFEAIPWRQGMTVLLSGVLFHFYGWANMLISMLTSSTIITHRGYNNDQILHDIENYGVNAWVSSASRLRGITSYMETKGMEPVKGMEWITCSGSPLTPYEVHQVNKYFDGPVLHNNYGSTETAGLAISTAEELAADPTLTGRIHPGYVIEIRDDEGNLLPDGEIGEIYAGCYDMFMGYTDPSVPVRTANHLLRMGDRGYRKGDRLYVKGRADDLVITQFGEKIFPSEIEDLLIRDPRVGEVHVHGVPDPKFGQALRAYIIRAEGVTAGDLGEEEIRNAVRDQLSDAHVPRDVFFVADFPRNPMGKVIRPELPGHSTV